MSEIPLKRLRSLRDRAVELLQNLDADLRPFVKSSDRTFRRKPDSRDVENDINVTTTCSCLMALAATHSFLAFYEEASTESAQQAASKILQTIINAPWMSSGLADNNPFTTSVVCRAYGFLLSEGLIPDLASNPTPSVFERPWESTLEILNVTALGHTLFAHGDPTAEFLWLSLSDITRDKIKQAVNDHAPADVDLRRSLALDLRRVIESGWIFGEARFDKASPRSRMALDAKPTGYSLVTVNRQLLSDQYPDLIAAPRSLNLTEIAQVISKHSEHFAINSYPPSSAVLYWFVDGISRAKIQLPEDHWTELCTWATREFNKKRSLVVSDHYAMMDPIAMGMAACLCARLRSLCDASEPNTSDKHRSLLPSVIELDHAIAELVDEQTPSGIWPKYFPLFHYQDAGSNFCFAFELLEGLLTEFGRQPHPSTFRPTIRCLRAN